ncbi:hypothetical protein [Nocardia sp. CNY236]|uniref:hypothetical protein n=1 Tax=Nocardia sp. CNY236 TaxID=1169152 RepID=UPI00041B7058|nr:hypothetical protein [Nocardia sp. CNY236]
MGHRGRLAINVSTPSGSVATPEGYRRSQLCAQVGGKRHAAFLGTELAWIGIRERELQADDRLDLTLEGPFPTKDIDVMERQPGQHRVVGLRGSAVGAGTGAATWTEVLGSDGRNHVVPRRDRGVVAQFRVTTTTAPSMSASGSIAKTFDTAGVAAISR